MAELAGTLAYVRTEEAPKLPPPAGEAGVRGWLIKNLFATPFDSVLTIVFGLLAAWILWGLLDWGIFRATWTGSNGAACAAQGAGACWPFMATKFPQWVYGFFPIDQRWRVNLCFIIGAAALIPMLIPSVAYKGWNLLFLLIAYPLITMILLTGGNFGFTATTYGILLVLCLIGAAALPLIQLGIEDTLRRNAIGMALAGLALLPVVISLLLVIVAAIVSFLGQLLALVGLGDALSNASQGLSAITASIFAVPKLGLAIVALLAASAVLGLLQLWRADSRLALSATRAWLFGTIALFAIAKLLDTNYGLVPVDTSQWGGLTVTLIVAITGMVASLPLGVLLALGRRSEMPIVRIFSVVFIELWRGVPLITVLFMSSVMLPLFLPAGMNFDKLLRALIGVALFTAAYMAETVRGGLQAIPKGQYEGAMAVGLSYWQMMNKVILPQALKISIPNIVSSFIALFKDTTLVSIIGIFDLLNMARAGIKDTAWASPATTPTVYISLALVFFVFCFSLSRYSMYTERRLHTGHKR